MQDLIESDLLIECYKFSKYGQSVYSFFPNNVHLIPKWVQENEDLLKQSDDNANYNDHNVQQQITLDNKQHKLFSLSMPSASSFSLKKAKTKKKKVAGKKPVNPKVYFSMREHFRLVSSCSVHWRLWFNHTFH
eukprot:TRINITY_DN1138_c0_g1_i1.p1 TRINITY_DN1138_c0_g1~~TRINITY_DN1138_c0_g1_i1.p1  ORF type:complete len:133 (-),score=29.23 TRINITY_DN1138_c0_g1_i1:313-711(-)